MFACGGKCIYISVNGNEKAQDKMICASCGKNVVAFTGGCVDEQRQPADATEGMLEVICHNLWKLNACIDSWIQGDDDVFVNQFHSIKALKSGSLKIPLCSLVGEFWKWELVREFEKMLEKDADGKWCEVYMLGVTDGEKPKKLYRIKIVRRADHQTLLLTLVSENKRESKKGVIDYSVMVRMKQDSSPCVQEMD